MLELTSSVQVGSVVTVVSQNHVDISAGDCRSNESSVVDSADTDAVVAVKKDHGVLNSTCTGGRDDQFASESAAWKPGCDGGAGRLPASDCNPWVLNPRITFFDNPAVHDNERFKSRSLTLKIVSIYCSVMS